MIQVFVDRFMEKTDELKAAIAKEPPSDYGEIVSRVVEAIRHPVDVYGEPDPTRITCIDHGDYQGTLIFVIGAEGYQPSRYWYVSVSYGSCSGCDTLQAIRDYSDKPLSKQQINDYWTLMLHVVQELKEME